MAVSKKLKEFLDRSKIKYQVTEHSAAYTAQEVAGSQHVPGKQMVKSVIIKSGGQFVMCVLPAIHLIDFKKLSKVLKSSQLTLADEEDLADLFPDYELGAEPPFGTLYGLEIIADKILEEDEEIAFNAGTHTDVVKMKFKDYKELAKPKIADIGTHI